MTAPTNKWAILIGVDHYDDGGPHKTPRKDKGGQEIMYHNLYGCVNDVLAVEDYLVNRVKVPRENIKKLLAPNRDRPRNSPWQLPTGPRTEPTYKNIRDALRQVAKSAKEAKNAEPGKAAGKIKPGDFVYIHYSGHGARATTVFSHLRASSGDQRAGAAVASTAETEDHAMVPCDVLYGGAYLRDLEIALLLQDIVDQGLTLTVVLDCCHSGGFTRGDELTRGIEEVYVSNPAVDEPDNMEDIAALANGPTWFEEPKGFVVLAACQKLQKANEKAGRGFLTKWLLNILGGGPTAFPSQALYGAVSHKVAGDVKDSEFPRRQSPYLVGETDRFFFDQTVQPHTNAITVIDKDTKADTTSDRWVQLDAGTMHCVYQDAVYNILARDSALETQQADIIAQVKIKEVTNGQSTAIFTNPENIIRWEEIVEGCPALLVGLPVDKRSVVRFVSRNDTQRDTFSAFWQDLYCNGPRLTLNNDKPPMFEVSVDTSSGCFLITGQLGDVTTTMGKALPPLSIAEKDLELSMKRLIIILEHLARYAKFKGLVNNDLETGKLAKLTSITTCPASEPLTFGNETLHPVPKMELDLNEKVYEVEEKRLFRVKVRNDVDRKVHFAIFDCSAEFAIEKMYPSGRPYETLTRGESSNAQGYKNIALTVAIPDELRRAVSDGSKCIDTFKVFVSVQASDLIRLDSLTLPALSEVDLSPSHSEGTAQGTPETQLQSVKDFLASLGENTDLPGSSRTGYHVSEGPPLKPAEWQTEDVRIRIMPSHGNEPQAEAVVEG